MSVHFNPSSTIAPVTAVANSQQTMGELVNSFFPNLDESDHAWMCKLCSQISSEGRETILAQIQELIPGPMKHGDIRPIVEGFLAILPTKETVIQAKRLIKVGMRPAEIIQITNKICRIYHTEREVIITQALRLITPQMNGNEIVTILSLLKSIVHEHQIPMLTNLALSVIRPTMSPEEIKAILKTIIDLSFYAFEDVVRASRPLITDSTSGQEICELLKRMKQVPSERLELIRTRIGNQLTSETKISLLFLRARTEEFFPRLTAGLSDEEMPKMLEEMEGCLNPEEIEKICEYSLPFISENMSLKTRMCVLLGVATHSKEGFPLSPVPPNLRFRSVTNPSSPSLPLGDLPRDLRWRLTIDREDQRNGRGPDCFDRAPHTSSGYRQAMEGSLQLIDLICSYRMNHQLLGLLHDVSVHEVSDTQRRLKKGYCYDSSCYYFYYTQEIANESRKQLDLENRTDKLMFTPEIEKELREGHKNLSEWQLRNLFINERNDYLAQSEQPDSSNKVRVISLFGREDETRITKILDRFYEEAAAAKSMDEKYAAVARCCRALIVFHAFPDGNGRTISFNLLTILLHQIGSPPCIPMRPPYFFNGTKTVRQMVEFIKEGVEYFQRKKIEVLIGEYAEMTPADKDAENYVGLSGFYELLDPCFTSERK